MAAKSKADAETEEPRTAPPARRRPGRPSATAPPAAPEGELLRRALEIFAEHGYEGASIRLLSRRLGVSHNLIHWRFGSKENLWRKALDYSQRANALQPGGVFSEPYDSDEDRLRALVVRYAEWAAANPDVVGLMNVEGRRDSWRLDYLHANYVTPFHAQLETLLRRIAETRGAASISSEAFMVLLVHGVGSYFALRPLMRRLAPDAEVSPAVMRRDAEQFAGLLLGSVLGRSGTV